MLKFDESSSGEGNAVFAYPESDGRAALAAALERLVPAAPEELVVATADAVWGRAPVATARTGT